MKSNLKQISNFVLKYQKEVNYQITINDIDTEFQNNFLNFLNDNYMGNSGLFCLKNQRGGPAEIKEIYSIY